MTVTHDCDQSERVFLQNIPHLLVIAEHKGKYFEESLLTRLFWGTMKVKWHPAKYCDPYSEFLLCIYPLKVHTHSSEHPQTVNTPSSGQPFYAVEQLWVQCLAQEHLSRRIEDGESAGHSLPPPTIPAGPRLELATFGLWVWLSNH